MDEQSIFLTALEKSNPDERAAWLSEVCGGDDALKQHILELLERHQEAQSFLEQPPAEYDATIVQNAADDNLAEVLDAGLALALGDDAAIVVGIAGHGVLQSLGNTIDLPHVVLRESAGEGPDPITRPQSPEMPSGKSDCRYQLQGEIARGGMGAIIKGRDTDLGRDLAIKVLLDSHKDKPEVIQRFVEEAQIGGQLQHPGIAPIYELGQFSDKRPFFSMKLVKGQTLSRLLGDREDASEDRGRFLGIFEQVCQTMAYAHSRGVIHRDLKPANIMVGAFGEVQVMDWGLAKVLSVGGVADEKKAYDKQQGQSVIQTLRSQPGSDAPGTFGSLGSQTQMGSVMGTPAYMPPEQALGEIDNLDERADVFGLGAILCEILTGQPPYVADDGTQVYRMASRGKLEGCFERLDSCGADTELIAITKECLELEPHNRPRDAGVLAKQVAGYLESVEEKLRQSEVDRAAEAARVVELRRRRKLLYVIASLLLIGLITAGVTANHFRNLETIQRQLAQKNHDLAKEREQERNAALAARAAEKLQRDRAEQQAHIAEQARLAAQQQRDLNRRNLYIAQIQLAQQARERVQGIAMMSSLLNAWLPEPDATDHRGWEWFYLESLKHTEDFTINSHRSAVRVCKWSPDGRFIATGGDDAMVTISLATNGCTHKELAEHTERVTSLSWHPDGIQLVSASQDRSMRVWDVSRGICTAELNGLEQPITTVAWSHDGKRIAWGSESKVCVWDAESEEVLHSIDFSCAVIAWTAADAGVVIHQGRNTFVWDLSSNAPPRLLFEEKDNFTPGLAVSRDGRNIATANQSDLNIRDLKTGQILKTLRGHKLPPLSMDFSPDGRKLASAGGEGWVAVWDLQNGTEENMFYGQSGDVVSVGWHPDGQRLASAAKDVRIWNTRQTHGELEIQTSNERTFAVVWSPDGRRIATAGQRGQIEVRDTETGQLLVSMPAHEGWTEGLAWHPTRPWLASCDRADRLRIWNSESGALIREINSITQLRSIAWKPDGLQIACSGQSPDGEVILLDATSWEVVGKLNRSDSIVTSVKWKPDGTRVAAVGADGMVRVWDSTNGNLITTFPGITCLAWSNTGDRLATTAGPITIRDTAEWTEIASLHGHTSMVYSLDWSTDDSRLVSSSQDSTANLWDTTSSSLVMTLQQGRDQLHAAAWDPDSLRIASVDSRGFLHIIDARFAAGDALTRNYLGVLDRRLASTPDDITTLHRRWLWYLRHGQDEDAKADHARLVQLYQRRLAKEPDERIALKLAEVLLNGTDNLPARQVLQPTELHSASGCTLNMLADGAILTGPAETPDGDSYRIRGPSPIRRISGLWLETIPHQSLPNNGVGWGGGNFHLTNVTAELRQPDGSRRSVVFQSAFSNCVRPFGGDTAFRDGPWGAVDGSPATHWDVWPHTRTSRWLALQFPQPVDIAEDEELIIQLEFKDPLWSRARLGCFRVAVYAEGLDSRLLQLSSLFEKQELDGVDLLAAAYLIKGEVSRSRELIESTSKPATPARVILRTLADMASGQSDSYLKNAPHLTEAIERFPVPRELQGLCQEILVESGTHRLDQVFRLFELAESRRELERLADGITIHPDEATSYLSRANYLSQLGRWNEAVEDLERCVELDPGNRTRWAQLCTTRLLANDREGYLRDCKRMRVALADSSTAEFADSLCKINLLLPDAVDLAELPTQRLREGIDDPEWARYRGWFVACQALVSLREGRLEEAIEWTQKLPLRGHPWAMTLAVRALAEAQLGKSGDAAASLREAETLIPPELRTLGSENYHGPLPVAAATVITDWLIPEILRREAEALLKELEEK